MIKKRYIFLFIGFLIVTTITTAVTLLPVFNASFIPEQKVITRHDGNITFNCGFKPMSVYLNEPNMNIDDDFEVAVSKVCNKTVSNVIDWNGRRYQETSDGKRSFDKIKLTVK